MTDKNLEILIEKYLDKNWETIIQEIDNLVKIPSFVEEDGQSYSEKYPTGKKPVEAMEEALKIANRMGFKTKNHKNYIGIADYEGKSKKMIGFIGHCDVVSDGFGWKFDPFKLTRRNGYVIGRGVVDDKGPTIISLHAINFWIEQNKINNTKFPYTIRYLFGTNEEDGMLDIECYKKDFEEPSIVITPDADFPICYGEKGLTRCTIVSSKIKDGQIKVLEAGTADNALAGRARAVVELSDGKPIFKQGSRLAHAISIEPTDKNKVQITAKGRSAHASTPYEGIDSIAVLANFLLEKDIGNKQEKEFLNFIIKIAGKPDGREIGLNYHDKDFGELTIIPSLLKLHNNRFIQVFDCRYPTGVTGKIVNEKLIQAAPDGYGIFPGKDEKPFLINPNSKVINSLAKSYTEATNNFADVFTIGGSTYARNFKCGASFGPEMQWLPLPAWVGKIHAPDEGISEQALKDAFKIYVYAIKNLMQLDIESDSFLDEVD